MLCDPIWHVSFGNSKAFCELHAFTFLLTLYLSTACGRCGEKTKGQNTAPDRCVATCSVSAGAGYDIVEVAQRVDGVVPRVAAQRRRRHGADGGGGGVKVGQEEPGAVQSGSGDGRRAGGVRDGPRRLMLLLLLVASGMLGRLVMRMWRQVRRAVAVAAAAVGA